MKKAIVLGATGLIGHNLIDQLCISDHVDQVIAVTRRPFDHGSDKVINQVVDFERLDDVASVFQGDYLFSCLGTTKKQAGSIQAQRRVDLDYQSKVAEIAAMNGVNHYLLVSSSGANEKSRSSYLQMKGELERKVMSLSFKRISIFQPSLLLGNRPESRLGEHIGSLLLPALCMIPGLRRYRPIAGSEVALKMLLISQQQEEHLATYKLDEVFTR